MINIMYSLFLQTILENAFDWDEQDQGIIISSFFWLYWISQVPGGMLARRYGAKKVFGLTNLFSSLLCALTPICAYGDIILLIAIRVVQGLICVCYQHLVFFVKHFSHKYIGYVMASCS